MDAEFRANEMCRSALETAFAVFQKKVEALIGCALAYNSDDEDYAFDCFNAGDTPEECADALTSPAAAQ